MSQEFLLTDSMMSRNDDNHKSSNIKQNLSTIMSAFYGDLNNINNVDWDKSWLISMASLVSFPILRV